MVQARGGQLSLVKTKGGDPSSPFLVISTCSPAKEPSGCHRSHRAGGTARPPRPQLELLPPVCTAAPRSVSHKPPKRNLPRAGQCERSDRDSNLGPCHPVRVLEQAVPAPRDPCAEGRIVSQDPNLRIQDAVQLPVSACAPLPTRGSFQAALQETQ